MGGPRSNDYRANQDQPNYTTVRNKYLTEHSGGDISVGCKTHSLDYWLDHMPGFARQFRHEYTAIELDSLMVQILEIYKRRFRERLT